MKATNLRLACLMIILASLQCFASSGDTTGDEISLKVMAELYPTASRILPVQSPVPHIVAFGGREKLGYSFYTDLITPIPAYSGFPIRSLVSLSPEGKIIEVRIIYHQEPILVIGVDDKILSGFIAQYKGMSVTDGIRIRGAGRPNSIDGISGATITAMV